MQTSMRASFYEGPGRFSTGTVAVPKAAAGEALLRVRRVGICGTDLHIFQGHLDHRVPRGGVIGHETFAEVVDAPAGSGFGPGDRVVVEPVLSCGRCRSEERRVGKECRARWSRDHEIKKGAESVIASQL